MTVNWPKITILIVTLNNRRTLPACLNSIIKQDYPRKLIEYLNIDGGSTDNTKKIMSKYGFKIVNSPVKKNVEAQRAIGLKKARNNLIVSIDADNYLPNKNWLKQMIFPFLEDQKIIYSGTLHYRYEKKASLYNRYVSLFGVLDPLVYYIGKPDRLPQNIRKWTKSKIIQENKNYYTVEFDEKTLPTVGCNGVVYKKDILLKYAKSDIGSFLHIDVFADLLKKGFNRYAIVKNDVVHDTAATLSLLMKKRIAFLSDYYLRSPVTRRYLIFSPKRISDNIRLFLYILYTVTLIRPLSDSLRGYMRIPDMAWFLHPFICLVFLYSYFIAAVQRFIKKI